MQIPENLEISIGEEVTYWDINGRKLFREKTTK
jgi:hypothetical protein